MNSSAETEGRAEKCCLHLGTLYILAGGFVGKCFVQGQPFELADLVLVNFPTTIPALPPRGLGQTSPQIGPSRPDRSPA